MDAVHPDGVAPCIATYTPEIEARRAFRLEYRLRSADGAYRWVLDSAVPKYGPDGSFTGYVGCVIDINERKQDEDLIRKSRDALEVSNREIQQLAGKLLTAHEDEHRRLARDLHDDITQRLARLAIDAGRLEQSESGDRSALAAIRNDLVRLARTCMRWRTDCTPPCSTTWGWSRRSGQSATA